MQILTLCAALAATLGSFTHAQSFGYSTSADAKKWVINSGDGLSVTMLRATCDIVSIKYNNQELQYSAKYTHVNSGLGSVTSSIKTLDDEKKTIQISCEKTGLSQYYFFRPNENTIYLGTYHSEDLVLPELRFLARLSRSTVSTGITEATLDGMNEAIEAEDIVANSKNITRSKFYSAVPFIHDRVHGAKGPNAGVYFVMSPYAYETSIGGPFFRDINNKCTTVNELSFYMNSDHTRTEAYRYGFHGPYALTFTTGAAPSPDKDVDFGFFQGLGLKGFVDAAERGRVTGKISDTAGLLRNNTIVVTFSNDAAQYWTELAKGDLEFTSPLMKPGTYTMTVYKKQLAVATATVEVTAAKALSQDIAVQFKENPDAIWQIGEWDGTPDGFLNADKIAKMHPSDARMAKWKPITFSADNDADAQFPMALFRGVNDPLTLTFNLSTSEAAKEHVLKIGITIAQANGRVVVKANDKWTSPTPATKAVTTRGVTRGVTVGNYVVDEYKIPSTALVAGMNKLVLTIASGNSDPPQKFLHASVVFDALELD